MLLPCARPGQGLGLCWQGAGSPLGAAFPMGCCRRDSCSQPFPGMLWTLVLILWAWKGPSALFALSWAGVVGPAHVLGLSCGSDLAEAPVGSTSLGLCFWSPEGREGPGAVESLTLSLCSAVQNKRGWFCMAVVVVALRWTWLVAVAVGAHSHLRHFLPRTPLSGAPLLLLQHIYWQHWYRCWHRWTDGHQGHRHDSAQGMDQAQAQQDSDGAQAASWGAGAKARSEVPCGGCPCQDRQAPWGPGGGAGFCLLRSCGTARSGRSQARPRVSPPEDAALESLSHPRALQQWGG